MMAGPTGAPSPLHPAGWPHHLVPCHRITGWVVEIMCPVIDLLRARLHHLLPCVIPTHQRHSLRNQDPEDFLLADFRTFVGHDQVHEVFDVWQLLSIELLHRYSSIQPLCMQRGTRYLHGLCINAQSLHHVAIIQAKGSGHNRVLGTNLHDEASFHPGASNHVLKGGGGSLQRRREKDEEKQKAMNLHHDTRLPDEPRVPPASPILNPSLAEMTPLRTFHAPASRLASQI